MTPDDLAADLRSFVVDRITALVATHLPGFAIPGVLGGHEVGPDARADLAFTIGLLAAGGVTDVAGTPIEDALVTVLKPTDGKRTNTFFSYRVAETLARCSAVLERMDDTERASLAEACDSTSYLPALAQGHLPRNYAAVLARCEHARAAVGLATDAAILDDLVARTSAMLRANPGGYLDDSNAGIGRYDIYSADIYLFTEPLAGRLGQTWTSGATTAARLVEKVAARNGVAVAWGRSTGALSLCLTVEMAGLALRHGLTTEPEVWVARAANAFASLRPWFDGGLIAAHQHRSTYAYRGPFRRLQMTLDCLGKLADAALALDDASFGGDAAPLRVTARDELVLFDGTRNAGVWTYRTRDLAFVLPMVGGTVTDYLPAPRNPGLFEVPVDSDLVTGVPLVFRRGMRYTAGGLPSMLSWVPGRLTVAHDGWQPAGHIEPPRDTPALGGGRRAVYRVEGRSLHVEERMTFDPVPHAVALSVAETAGRPLAVRFDASVEHTATIVDTAGMKEWRSFWAELPRVHQVDLRPAAEITLRWTVTPLLRVLSTAHGHHYDSSLYAPLADRVVTGRAPRSLTNIAGEWDQLHLHWPEWWLGADLDAHRAAIDTLGVAEVRIVWTQHNLVPHDRTPGWAAVYAEWASAADAVIHHTEWGMRRALDRYAYGDHTVHRVIAHGHWGRLMTAVASVDRADVEKELGLRSGVLRIGIVGAPRPDKRVDLAMEAITRCSRRDVELLVLSLGADDVVPDDPRVVALPYEMVPREIYNRRLATVDVLLMPYDDGDQLATGTVGDAVGLGLPSLVSTWGFLTESLGDAAISYGSTARDLAACIDNLDEDQISAAGRAARGLQVSQSWDVIAERHFALLEEVGTARL